MTDKWVSIASLILSILVAGGGFLISTSLVEHRVTALEKVVNVQGVTEFERWRTTVDFQIEYLKQRVDDLEGR